MNRLLWLAPIALFGLGFQAAPPAASGTDVVRLRSGTEIKGKVGNVASTGVTYTDLAGKTGTAKPEDVLSVTLADAPAALAKADAASAEMNFVRAINLYQVALEELQSKKGRPVHKQFILFNWAAALNGNKAPAEALEMFKRLRSECGDCFLRGESFRRSLEIARQQDSEVLEKVLAEMKIEDGINGQRAEYELAKLMYKKGQHDAAAPVFGKYSNMKSYPETDEASLWYLRCLRAQKKTGELETLCNRVLADKSSPPALAQAAGASLAEIQAKALDKDKTKARDVLMTCVGAISLGPPASKEEGEDYALALVIGGRCYVLMANAVEKPDAKEDYKSRAIGYYREAQKAFKGTPMADLATKELVALGVEEKSKEPPKDVKPK